MSNKMKFLITLVVTIVVSISVWAIATNVKDYSKHNFDSFYEPGFTWDMTKEDAKKYIEENAIMSWKTIEVEDNRVSDGFFYFYFDDNGKLIEANVNLGSDTGYIDTMCENYGDYDDYKSSKYGIGYYYWYGTLDGKKTKAYIYMPSDTMYIKFELEE